MLSSSHEALYNINIVLWLYEKMLKSSSQNKKTHKWDLLGTKKKKNPSSLTLICRDESFAWAVVANRHKQA